MVYLGIKVVNPLSIKSV